MASLLNCPQCCSGSACERRECALCGIWVGPSKPIMQLVLDPVAKCMEALSTVGEYGCSVCLHPGKRLQNNARVYLPDSSQIERTHEGVLSDAIEAQRTKTCVNGILSISALADSLDLV